MASLFNNCVYKKLKYRYFTKVIMIKSLAIPEPPMTEIIKLGTMAKHHVNTFLIYEFSRNSRKPYKNNKIGHVN